MSSLNLIHPWRLALALLAVCGGAGEIGAQVAAQRAAVQAWSDDQFENWVFNQRGNRETCRTTYDAQLKLRIEEIDRVCHLTEAQKQKLSLMGFGDIKQIFNSFERAKHQFNLLGNDIQKLQEIMPIIQPIQLAQRQLFKDGSLFAKSLRRTLTKEQFAQFEAVERERYEFEHQAQIELAVHTIEESMPIRDAQRRQLISLLTKEVKPSRTWSPYHFYILMSKIALLPENKVKPLLTDAQFKLWDKQMATYKNLIVNWRKAGIVVEEEKDELSGEGIK